MERRISSKRVTIFAVGMLAIPSLILAHEPWQRRPGVILYRLKKDVSPTQGAALSRAMGAAGRGVAAPAFHGRKSHEMMAIPAGGDEEALASALRASGAVEFAEPDYLMPAAALPNDPGYSAQWYHNQIGSPVAWDVTTGNPTVTVAVCDTGVDATHADLAANMSLPGYNVVNGTTDTTPVANHGTQVAGVLGAAGNNGQGMVGMGWTIKILPVRITNNPDTSAWCSDMASGIEWAADHGAKVINLSYETVGCPHTINAAAQYAQSQGALVVIAAGNQALSISNVYPQSHAFMMVGATDMTDQPAAFSNRGTTVDVVAPGVSMYTTLPGSSYQTSNGTSFSAPLVSGLAALLFSLNPAMTADQVKYWIQKSARAIVGLDGYGRIDAGATLQNTQAWMGSGSPPLAPLTPRSAILPDPVLSVPSAISLQSDISVGYPSGYPVSHFEWSVQSAVAPGTGLGPAAGSGFRTQWQTPDRSAQLPSRSLVPGYYLIGVKALDNSGNSSAEAQAYVNLVTALPDSSVRVFPNPWRVDRHAGARMTFDRMGESGTIRIFTISGQLVKTLPVSSNTASWDLTNESSQSVASGVYLFLAPNAAGGQHRGKLAVIR